MSELFSEFMSENKPVLKRSFLVNEEDYKLVQDCFAERGVMAYLPGLFFKLLSETLKEKGITNYVQRIQSGFCTTPTELVSDLRTSWKVHFQDDGRRTSSPRKRAKASARKSTNSKKPVQ